MASKDSIQGKIRPLPNATLEKASLQGAARVYVSRSSLIALTGSTEDGRACTLERLTALDDASEAGDAQVLKREASLWSKPNGQDLSANVVVMSKAFREAADFKLGDIVQVTVGDQVDVGREVLLQDETGPTEKGEEKLLYKPQGWDVPIAQALGRAGEVFPGMVFENIGIGRFRRNFKVLSVDGKKDGICRFKTEEPDGTVVKVRPFGVQDGEEVNGVEEGGPLVIEHLPGMENERKTINEWLRFVGSPLRHARADSSASFCVDGTQGTGKTYVLEKLEATKWAKTYWIRPEDKLSTIKEVFKLARAQGKAIVLIDNIDQLLGKDRSNREAVVRGLAGELEGLAKEAGEQMRRSAVLVVATCADYLQDMPPALRTKCTFQRTVVLPIPSEAVRLEMLKDINLNFKTGEEDKSLKYLAEGTHAFTPADLDKLARSAISRMELRVMDSGVKEEDISDDMCCVDMQDLVYAMGMTQPTAMHEINLKPPTVLWEDVAGQEAVKNALQYMLRFARNERDDNWHEAIKSPPKGLLLYGPPGCSKTLSAQALATESNFNFFAVKGAELLDMYVGESERAIRKLFQRARDASPSIIFFDEIDSIAKSRSGAGGRGSSAVNTVTTLLNEMDGFESLKSVIVVAATNRPEQMDSALLRTGRFDNMIFVGPPTQEARERIFNISLKNLKLEADVDIKELAASTEGNSGAEIKAICTAAGMIALQRCEGSTFTGISMDDLKEAVRRQPRKITQGMLDQYTNWAKQFERD